MSGGSIAATVASPHPDLSGNQLVIISDWEPPSYVPMRENSQSLRFSTWSCDFGRRASS